MTHIDLNNLYNPISDDVSKEEKIKRFLICKSCNKFIKNTTQCGECLCVMRIKTGISHASCPLGKW
jgi:hypothetical protein